jgi:4-amino-4-deoxy-L-arabinose transferase-like glycosyltransferase
MSRVAAINLQSPLIHILVLFVLSLPLVTNLGVSSLWDANESFYAVTPREMMESGDYLSPQFNYQPRAQKPPLTYWIIVISYKVFGITEFSVRLPGALAAIGVILFIYAIGRLLFSPTAGLLAALFLATTPRFFGLARKLPIDILLLFWLAGTAFFIIRAIKKNTTSSWIPVYLFLGFGFLTKGPVAWLIPGGAVLLWILWTRRLRIAQLRPFWGGFVLLAVVAPWYILTYYYHGWEYIAAFFLRDNLGRFATQSLGPARGLLYYFPVYLADFFPWSLLSLIALYYVWRKHRSDEPLRDSSFAFPLVWCGLVFIFFSLSRNKQEYYIASIYPMMAVVLAGVLDQSLRLGAEWKRLFSLWKWGYLLISLFLLALSFVLIAVLQSLLPFSHSLLHFAPSVFLFAGALSVAWYAFRHNSVATLLSLSVPIYSLFILAPIVYLPAIEPLRPVKVLCETIKLKSQPGDEVGYYRASIPSMAFYLHRPIFEELSPDEMARRFQGDRRVFCILTQKDFSYFIGERDLILYVIDRRPKFVERLKSLLDETTRAEEELILASNRSDSEEMSLRGTKPR